MARPKKQPHEQRTESTRADLTLAEKEHVREQARLAGISEAEYVRRCVLGISVAPAPAKVDAALITELNRIGVNVNQLARAVHTGRAFVTYWREIGTELTAILAKVARSYGGV